MSSHKTLDLKVIEGVAEITFDNGELNLLDIPLEEDFEDAINICEKDDAVRVIVLQSANTEFFIAHADLNMVGMVPKEQPKDLPPFPALVARIREMPKPSIAKIAGRARGGGLEVALACDMRFGAIGKCIVGLPEVGGGLIPGAGGTVNLPPLTGYARAAEVVLGSGDFSAELAERYGIINRAMPEGELDAYVTRLSRRIARFAPHAVALAKKSLQASSGDLRTSMFNETLLFGESMTDETRKSLAQALKHGGQTLEAETGVWEDVLDMAAAMQAGK